MTLTKVAILGSGNIGTDLAYKIMRSDTLQLAGVAGVDPDSDGLARMRRLGIRTTSEGVGGLLQWPDADEIEIVLEATSAKAHLANWPRLRDAGKRVVDLTPAAVGPFVVPSVNLSERINERNVNMVTCGGQATIPIVAAVARVVPVRYAEIVASISSRSAGPGTRANIDEFTATTARALRDVGGAEAAKAIIILNPADPPVLMRDTVHCLVDELDKAAITASITAMVRDVARYVRGYRLKQEIQFEPVDEETPVWTIAPGLDCRNRFRVSVYLEVEGAADYLPAYSGNLDIMTAASVQVAEHLAALDFNQMEVAR